ncbi:hypothetical protein VNO80_26208 [Phaseolus coccineus]|uniref:Uncharacterized protein n=1 Tax=Phaseolus coccineus TaxID=3886 RepID=A0AAN9LF65_PHACN
MVETFPNSFYYSLYLYELVRAGCLILVVCSGDGCFLGLKHRLEMLAFNTCKFKGTTDMPMTMPKSISVTGQDDG